VAPRSFPTTPESRTAQARLATATRKYGPDDERTRARRTEWEAERYIAILLDVPPRPAVMTDGQRARVVAALTPHVAGI
jgi:hypothetical protein